MELPIATPELVVHSVHSLTVQIRNPKADCTSGHETSPVGFSSDQVSAFRKDFTSPWTVEPGGRHLTITPMRPMREAVTESTHA